MLFFKNIKVMENKNLHILIQQLAEREKFADWQIVPLSFCSPAIDIAMDNYRLTLQKGDFAQMSYLYDHLDIRQSPRLLLDNTDGSLQYCYYIIVFLASYHSDTLHDNGFAKIAQYALGTDYHIILKQKLNNILLQIKGQIDNATGRCFTDSAPVLERTLASACGLGAIGKNGFLISKKAGIKTLIGGIILGIPKESTDYCYDMGSCIVGKQNLFSLCGECHRCMDACPTGALYAPGRVNADRCISYQTIENRKGSFPSNLPNPHRYIFGCDSCLNACPWNGKNSPGMDELVNLHPATKQLLCNPKEFLASISSSGFNKVFRNSPIGRAGRNKMLDTLNSLI